MNDVDPSPDTEEPDVPWRRTAWGVCGVVMVGLMVLPAVAGPLGRALSWTIPSLLVQIAVGSVYLLAVFFSRRWRAAETWTVAFILLIAIGMRAPMFFLAPPLEGDFNRYLWDGAVSAVGADPYEFSPERAADPNLPDPIVRALAREGSDVLARVNHPDLRTIHPPVAQGLFAAAHLLGPFDPGAWRAVLALLDAVTALLIVLLLRQAGLRLSLLAVYLWNPLLVFETYHGLHVDLAAAPAILLMLWALLRRRGALAGLALAAAVGVKLWPALLLPFLVGAFRNDRKRLIVSLAVLAAGLIALAGPFAGAFGDDSGVVAYSLNWQGRPSAYVVFEYLGRWLAWIPGLNGLDRHFGRGLMMLVLIAAACRLGLREAKTVAGLAGRTAPMIMLMLLLSPMLWPWCYVAVIPLAAFRPRTYLLIWTAMLPLFYRYGAQTPGEFRVAVIVHLHVWVMILAPYILRRWFKGPRKRPFARKGN